MKKIFTLVFFALPIGALAQGIELYIDGESTDVTGTEVTLSGGESIHENFDVVNVSGGALDLAVERVRLSHVSGAGDYVCWGLDLLSGVCYSESTVSADDPFLSPDVFTWNNLDTGLMSVYYIAHGNVGTSVYRYYVVDDGSGTRLDSVDVKFVSTVGIEEASYFNVSVYPNPVSSELKVELNTTNDANYEVSLRNIIGQEVLRTKIKNGVNKLDVSTLQRGVYFYSILTDGDAIKTKKLIVR